MRTDFAQHESTCKTLRIICAWLELETGLEFTETSGRRIGDKGVHGADPTRGKDLRMRNYMIGMVIEAFINDNWTYDHERPEKRCAMLHGEGMNMHLHIQTHPNTRRIK